MELLPFTLLISSIALAFVSQIQAASIRSPQTLGEYDNSLQQQLEERLPLYVVRRFDLRNLQPDEEISEYKAMSKRNNAEVVNHIMKNFGTLDRLSQVGK
uniref:Uncharacterized protein n=1 Tax=Acrobeloides nanus TaxID=290746 RepID=A0A914EI34_9BILA